MDFQLPPGKFLPSELLTQILVEHYPSASPCKSVYRALSWLTRQRFQVLAQDPDFILDPENYIFRLLGDNYVPEAIYLLRRLLEPIPYIRLYRMALVRGYLDVLNVF